MRPYEGMDELDVAINKMVRDLDTEQVKVLVKLAGDEILTEVAARAPVLTGALKASIMEVATQKGHSASVSIQVANSAKHGIRHYAVFIEYGHVQTKKARTRAQRQSNAGFEYVAAQPFMRPAFDAAAPRAVAKFVDGIRRIIGMAPIVTMDINNKPQTAAVTKRSTRTGRGH